MTGALLSDAISLTFVELSKLGNIVCKPIDGMTVLDKWALFLRYASDSTHRELINKLIASEEVLQVAGELLMSISQDERERAIFRSRKKFLTDMQSDLATARDNGLREGFEQGVEQGIGEGITIGKEQQCLDFARGLLAFGDPIDKIMYLTSLSRQEIEQLRTEPRDCPPGAADGGDSNG